MQICSWHDGVSKADACVKLEAMPDRPETSKRKQMSWSFLDEVSGKLTVVQKERQDMEMKAKLKAMLRGKDSKYISNLHWYDYTAK